MEGNWALFDEDRRDSSGILPKHSLASNARASVWESWTHYTEFLENNKEIDPQV